MSRKHRKRTQGGTATLRGRESSVRVLRDQVAENNLRIEEFRQRALLGAMASVAIAKTSDSIARAQRAFESAAEIVDPAAYLYDEYAGPGRAYQGVAPSAIWHTEEGRRYPVYINEWDLRPIRAMGYMMATFHPMGVGIMSKLKNYTIGKGIQAACTPDKRCAVNAEIQQATATAQGIVDDFIEINRVHGDGDREKFERGHRDGDGGLGLWHEGNGTVSMRFVEPDQITERLDRTHLDYLGYDGPESNFLFGVHSDNGDTNAVHGYAVQWSSAGNDWDYMPGGNVPFYSSEPGCPTASQETWMEFFKCNVDRNQKRGFTDFFSAEQYLTLATKVIGNAGEGAAVQSAIAFIREHAPGVTVSQIESFQLGLASNPGAGLGANGQTRYAEKFFPGKIIDVPQGQRYLNGPMGNQQVQGYIDVGDALARLAATRWDAPEWFFNGDASGTNRASSFVAESPFVKKEEVEKETECTFWQRVLWRVLGFNHRVGKFGDMPWQVLRRSVDLKVTAAQINVREPEKETARRLVMNQAGIYSDKHWAADEGLDLEQEKKDGATRAAAPQKPQPGMTGGSEQGGESAARSVESAVDPVGVALRSAEERFERLLSRMESAAGVMEGGPGSGIKGHVTEREELTKRPALAKGEAISAQRVGTGKDAKVILADGREAPPHIKAGDIPPAWKNVHVYTDPESEIWARGETVGKNGKSEGKAVYKPSYEAEMAAAKFVRTDALHNERPEIEAAIKADLKSQDPKVKEAAACAFLINEQATRPGSEADTKGVARHYGKPMTAENVVENAPSIGADGKQRMAKDGKPATIPLAIKMGNQFIPVNDKGTQAALLAAKASGNLHDSTFWLKSHGATTLEGRHVVQQPDGVHLQFVGKEGVWHDHRVDNPELAKMLLERRAAAGDKGKIFATSDTKLQEYVKGLDHGRFSPKDFRTARANEIAATEVAKLPAAPPKDEKEAKARKMAVAATVSRKLGNRPEQCIESYINPVIWQHQSFQHGAAA